MLTQKTNMGIQVRIKKDRFDRKREDRFALKDRWKMEDRPFGTWKMEDGREKERVETEGRSLR